MMPRYKKNRSSMMPRYKKNRNLKKKHHREPRKLQQESTRAVRRKPKIARKFQKPEEQAQRPHGEPLFKKTTYEVGDRVKAIWWETNDWHDGKVHGYRIVDKSSKYGEVRQYHIKFLDGDEDKKISEEYVWSPYEYQIAFNEEFSPERLRQKRGIEILFDLETTDPYAKKKGFFKLKYTGEKLYGSYMQVFGAYDEAIIERNDPTDISFSKDLLIPENWKRSKNQILSKVSYLKNNEFDDFDEEESISTMSEYSNNTNCADNEMIGIRDVNGINEKSSLDHQLNYKDTEGSRLQGSEDTSSQRKLGDIFLSTLSKHNDNNTLQCNQHLTTDSECEFQNSDERRLFEEQLGSQINTFNLCHKAEMQKILEQIEDIIDESPPVAYSSTQEDENHQSTDKHIHHKTGGCMIKKLKESVQDYISLIGKNSGKQGKS